MFFNKIDTDSLGMCITITNKYEYKLDDHITIKRSDNFGYIEIYIDDIKVFELHGCSSVRKIYYYYYKMPRSVVKKINQWSRNEVKQQRLKERNKKHKIEQHIKELYK